MSRSLLAAALIALLPALLACAPTIPAAAMQELRAETPADSQAQEIAVTGTNTCLGCDLKGAHGAAAQCSVYGHRHGLRVASARVAGADAPEWAGRTLHYLDNDASAALVSGESAHGQQVAITGRLFRDEQMIEVASFEIVAGQ